MPKLVNSLPKYWKQRASCRHDQWPGSIPHGTRTSKHEYDRLVAECLTSGRSLSFGAAMSTMDGEEVVDLPF